MGSSWGVAVAGDADASHARPAGSIAIRKTATDRSTDDDDAKPPTHYCPRLIYCTIIIITTANKDNGK